MRDAPDTLKEFVAGRSAGWPAAGIRGRETDWLPVGEFKLHGGRLCAVDATMPFAEDGVVSQVPPGTYTVEGKAMTFAGDIRVSRLRAFVKGALPELAEALGEAPTDLALLAICDIDEVEAADDAAEGDEAGVGQQVMELEITGAEVVTLTVGRNAVTLAVSESGFGDGAYPVFALRENGRIVGIEVEFLTPGYVTEATAE